MCKVIFEFMVADKYKVLSVDEMPNVVNYNKYLINGIEYNPVTIYDMPNCIAIGNIPQSLVGEEVLFV